MFNQQQNSLKSWVDNLGVRAYTIVYKVYTPYEVKNLVDKQPNCWVAVD
jgi:hypothetical protein